MAVQAVMMQVWPGDHQGHGRQENPRHGRHPGGVNKTSALAERDVFLKDVDQQMTWAKSAVKIAREYTTTT